VKWQKLEPTWGSDSPDIAILGVDPETKANRLLIRHPAAMHIPRHWHTANGTYKILRGTYVFEYNGTRDTLAPGSSRYFPAKMIHEAWAPGGGLYLVTFDGKRDLNWENVAAQRPPRR